MDKRKVEKVAALLIVAVIVILAAFAVNLDNARLGNRAGCGIAPRLVYPFLHVSVFHAVLNGWAFLSLIFVYDITYRRLLLAYLLAVCVPVDTLSLLSSSLAIPTVGLSGIIYVLFGSISFEVVRKRYYQMCMASYLFIGFFLPGTNALLHLWCYLCGFIVALLNKPIKRRTL